MTTAAPALRSPFAGRGPFYYGWVNVGVAAVAMSATLPGRTYGLGLIKEPVLADLRLTDLDFSLLNFWAIVIGATCCLPVGRLLDRLGARVVLTGVAVLLGIGVVAMSRVTETWQFAVALTIVRGLGQGALSVVAIALVGKWFQRRVGPAMAVFTVLLSIGFVLPIALVGGAVESQGWRPAWQGVGLTLLFGLAPLGWLVARSTPESIGVEGDEPDAAPAVTVPLRQAVATRAFWTFTLAAALFNFTFSALTLDNAALMRERGLDPDEVNTTILGVLMVSGLPANFVAGWLVRRRPMGKVLAAGVMFLAASLLLFPLIADLGTAMAYAALLGVSGGVITVVFFAVYGHTYGRTHLGSIQSFVQVMMVLSSATGPVALSACRDHLGGPQPFFFISAGLAILLAALTWSVRPTSSEAGPPADAPSGSR